VYFVTFYAAEPAQFHRMPEVYPRHRAYLDEFALGGEIWLIGTFGDPSTEGSMAIFRSRDAAERFIAGDPFVLEGMVQRSEIREWEPLEYPAAAELGADLD
jgi:uncharacterized protein YciI